MPNLEQPIPSAAKTDEPETLTISVEEAGRMLGIGRSCVYEMARTGALPVIRCGRKLRVPRAVLRRMLGE